MTRHEAGHLSLMRGGDCEGNSLMQRRQTQAERGDGGRELTTRFQTEGTAVDVSL